MYSESSSGGCGIRNPENPQPSQIVTFGRITWFEGHQASRLAVDRPVEDCSAESAKAASRARRRFELSSTAGEFQHHFGRPADRTADRAALRPTQKMTQLLVGVVL